MARNGPANLFLQVNETLESGVAARGGQAVTTRGGASKYVKMFAMSALLVGAVGFCFIGSSPSEVTRAQTSNAEIEVEEDTPDEHYRFLEVEEDTSDSTPPPSDDDDSTPPPSDDDDSTAPPSSDDDSTAPPDEAELNKIVYGSLNLTLENIDNPCTSEIFGKLGGAILSASKNLTKEGAILKDLGVSGCEGKYEFNKDDLDNFLKGPTRRLTSSSHRVWYELVYEKAETAQALVLKFEEEDDEVTLFNNIFVQELAAVNVVAKDVVLETVYIATTTSTMAPTTSTTVPTTTAAATTTSTRTTTREGICVNFNFAVTFEIKLNTKTVDCTRLNEIKEAVLMTLREARNSGLYDESCMPTFTIARPTSATPAICELSGVECVGDVSATFVVKVEQEEDKSQLRAAMFTPAFKQALLHNLGYEDGSRKFWATPPITLCEGKESDIVLVDEGKTVTMTTTEEMDHAHRQFAFILMPLLAGWAAMA